MALLKEKEADLNKKHVGHYLGQVANEAGLNLKTDMEEMEFDNRLDLSRPGDYDKLDPEMTEIIGATLS